VHEQLISSIILGASALTSRGVPIAGEYEVKNAQAMKIMHSLGAGGSFTEYYAVDFNDDAHLRQPRHGCTAATPGDATLVATHERHHAVSR
jgi:L-arabinose isomerase